ncbi:MAG TPA: alpha/beta fold hydrolase [Candidatus Acidoferrales bacterium]|nr:alpha/beta fold hydrolase [Candidatus Acidoferrales bacterium]
MAVLSELRFPTARLAKIFSGLLALFLFGIVSLATVSGFLLYQILRPARTPAAIDLSIMMGHPATFSFSLADGSTREGWLFPGFRGAPAIVVCHGYLSQRADVLTLVTALQEHQFNVFLFDFSGHGTSIGHTTLGYRETSELRSAVQALAARDDVDPQHFGLWGVDMGGYAALEVAASDPRIAALAVDDAYDDPRDMLNIEVKKSGLTALPETLRFSDFGFRMLNYGFRNEPPVSTRLGRTKGIPKLFILADDRPALADESMRLFLKAPDPKVMLQERMSYRDMTDDDRKTYESQIVNFFLQNIPPTPAR